MGSGECGLENESLETGERVSCILRSSLQTKSTEKDFVSIIDLMKDLWKASRSSWHVLHCRNFELFNVCKVVYFVQFMDDVPVPAPLTILGHLFVGH